MPVNIIDNMTRCNKHMLYLTLLANFEINSRIDRNHPEQWTEFHTLGTSKEELSPQIQ